ncbi:MAG: hypothetical protein OEQ18_00855 [Gammaproteobacteria bacterium]|nr:hypothetical protein [Gammaproteobacteria bacterium]
MYQAIRLIAILLASVLAAPISASGEERAAEYIEFSYDFHSECVNRNGKMLLIRNTHPAHTIKLYLDRFFGDKRQPGRAAHTLSPAGEPIAVGCTVVAGLAQNWEVAKAVFVR